MMKTIILLGGYPGAGKSYICNRIMEQANELILVSQDDIKEYLFDEIGFCNMKEKQDLIEVARNLYYYNLEEIMKQEKSIITDYPFSSIQKPIFERLVKEYHYQVITIRLVGDLEVLYQRRIMRDLKPDRHLGHIVSTYHKGDTLADRRMASELITHDEFLNVCTNKGYDTFGLGNVIEVDMSDFSKVEYKKLVTDVVSML